MYSQQLPKETCTGAGVTLMKYKELQHLAVASGDVYNHLLLPYSLGTLCLFTSTWFLLNIADWVCYWKIGKSRWAQV